MISRRGFIGSLFGCGLVPLAKVKRVPTVTEWFGLMSYTTTGRLSSSSLNIQTYKRGKVYKNMEEFYYENIPRFKEERVQW